MVSPGASAAGSLATPGAAAGQPASVRPAAPWARLARCPALTLARNRNRPPRPGIPVTTAVRALLTAMIMALTRTFPLAGG